MFNDLHEEEIEKYIKRLEWLRNEYDKLLEDYNDIIDKYNFQYDELQYYKDKYGEKKE